MLLSGKTADAGGPDELVCLCEKQPVFIRQMDRIFALFSSVWSFRLVSVSRNRAHKNSKAAEAEQDVE